MTEVLNGMEEELEAQCEEVNRRIFSGENQHVKLSRNKSGEIFWTLPYVGDEEAVDNPFSMNCPRFTLPSYSSSSIRAANASTHSHIFSSVT